MTLAELAAQRRDCVAHLVALGRESKIGMRFVAKMSLFFAGGDLSRLRCFWRASRGGKSPHVGGDGFERVFEQLIPAGAFGELVGKKPFIGSVLQKPAH